MPPPQVGAGRVDRWGAPVLGVTALGLLYVNAVE